MAYQLLQRIGSVRVLRDSQAADEYVVRLDGNIDADYYTDDKEDALDTARAMNSAQEVEADEDPVEMVDATGTDALPDTAKKSWNDLFLDPAHRRWAAQRLVGKRVRSFDFPDAPGGREPYGPMACFYEGIVLDLTDMDTHEQFNDCDRYKILVTGRMFRGKPSSAPWPLVYPPLNGTPTMSDRQMNGVQVLGDATVADLHALLKPLSQAYGSDEALEVLGGLLKRLAS